jgi:hypothetical protein
MNKIFKNEKGFSAVEVVLVIVVIVLIGTVGWLVYKNHHKTVASSAVSTTKISPSKPAKPKAVNPYAGWDSYTSSFEKLSFKYPSDWTPVTYDYSTEINGADSLKLTSPSGNASVAWYSAVEGIGGACSVDIMPGTTVSNGSLGPCPYWYVLDKQKLTGADLYYVDGVVEESDGDTYSAWCSLQAPNGIVQNESNIGYMLFLSKYNQNIGADGKDLGPYQPALLCGNDNFGGQIGPSGTKAQATAFLSTPEFQQAKLILLSATY